MLRRVRVLVVLVSLAGALSVGAAGALGRQLGRPGDSYAAGPLIPSQRSTRSAACARTTTSRIWPPRHSAARWPTPPAAARRPRHDGATEHARRHQPAAVQRPRRRDTTSSRCRSAATTSASPDPRELRDRQPVRAPVPGQVRRQRRHRPMPAGSPPPPPRSPPCSRASTRARPSARVSSSTTRRSCPTPAAAAGRRCRSRSQTCPTCAAWRGPQHDARPAGGRHGARMVDDYTASVGRDACKSSRRAGSSRSSRPTRRRPSTPTPAARRGSRPWWWARCRAKSAGARAWTLARDVYLSWLGRRRRWPSSPPR